LSTVTARPAAFSRVPSVVVSSPVCLYVVQKLGVMEGAMEGVQKSCLEELSRTRCDWSIL
jgi:hypothetical protein